MNRDFADMLSALSDAGADYLVVGAYALAAHGRPRATGDLDIWVRPTAANAEKVWGWAWDKSNPGAGVAVDIFDGETLLASILATEHRRDIASYTKDNGCHAFVYELPAGVKDGLPHNIRVKISGTNIDAYGTPKVFTSSSSNSGR